MDYMVLDVLCPKKANTFNHSLTHWNSIVTWILLVNSQITP